MKYYVDVSSYRVGDGSQKRPFCRIQDAANIAVAGDEIIVAPGIYREYVNPINAGTEGNQIVYRSEVPLGAVITGAESVKTWKKYDGDTYVARIGNGIFGAYNPYTTVIWGDWYSTADALHTGEVYLNGRSMYEVQSLEEVLDPKPFTPSWEDHEWTRHKWYTCQDGGDTLIYANFLGADPNAENVEINVRRNCFYPDKEGVGYITLSGFTVRQAATTWAPPTAYQEGMVGPHWSKGWIIEDCEISDSKCCGISLGKYLQPNNENKWSVKVYKDGTQTERDAICQAQREGWVKEKVGGHIIRNCHIHNCEQTGIVGHLGGVFSVIENNHIHHINNKQQIEGAEIGGIKLHAAIDVIIRGNHIHNCTRGLWLDWQAQGTRVTGNLFHDNEVQPHVKRQMGVNPGEDLFVEVSHGPTLIDNNIFMSTFAGRLCTQGVAYVHNLIFGSFVGVGEGTQNKQNGQPRYTPYHVPHRTEINGFMSILHGDDRFYNNIFVQNDSHVKAKIEEHWKAPTPVENVYNFTAGIACFDDYPTLDEWKQLFTAGAGEHPTVLREKRRLAYFNHLPVWTGGNVYFNGAKPQKDEPDAVVVDEKAEWKLVEKDGDWFLETNIYDLLPKTEAGIISTETLGEAFEPEEKYENPDGTPITFDSDFFGGHRPVSPLPGPFVCGKCAKQKLF